MTGARRSRSNAPVIHGPGSTHPPALLLAHSYIRSEIDRGFRALVSVGAGALANALPKIAAHSLVISNKYLRVR